MPKIDYEIASNRTRMLAWAPFGLSALFLLGMSQVGIREWVSPLLQENGPLELATFAVFLGGAVLGFRAVRLGFRVAPAWYLGLLTLFAIGLLFVAMEEIAWGQTFFDFASPKYFENNNIQGETTFHNLEGLHGNFQVLYLTFCLCGLVGAHGPIRVFGKRVVPPLAIPLLWTTLALMILHVLHATLDVEWSIKGIRFKIPELWNSGSPWSAS